MGNGSYLGIRGQDAAFMRRRRHWRDVVAAVDGGMSRAQAARHFNLGERTIYRILSRRMRKEFYGSFKKLAQKLSLPHFFAWTKCPEVNGMVERLVQTVREESLLDASEPETPTKDLTEEAQSFLGYNNNERRHSRTAYLTPIEYLTNYLHNPRTLPPACH